MSTLYACHSIFRKKLFTDSSDDVYERLVLLLTYGIPNMLNSNEPDRKQIIRKNR